MRMVTEMMNITVMIKTRIIIKMADDNVTVKI